jgi:hypothetical protein
MKSNIVTYKGYRFIIYFNTLIPYESPSKEIKITKAEAKKLLKKTGTYLIRWYSDWDSKQETNFWFIIKDIEENLESYNSNNKRKIRKSLKNCIVKKVSKKVIADNGYKVYKNAFLSYKTKTSLIKENIFNKEILETDENNEFWAVYKKDSSNDMIAYSKNVINNDSVNYSAIKFHPDYLKLYISYALFFEMNRYYINEKGYTFVNDGARSMLHDTNIQSFLESKFKFRKAYCNLHVVFSPRINFIVILLFPFRKFIYNKKNKIFNKLSVLLRHKEFSVE